MEGTERDKADGQRRRMVREKCLKTIHILRAVGNSMTSMKQKKKNKELKTKKS